jgi:hypothetical protein
LDSNSNQGRSITHHKSNQSIDHLVSQGGFQYFITFTDDFSRYGYIYLMRYKSESFEKFKEFQNEVQNQLGKIIKILRSDRGGEYLSLEFSDHLK